LEKNSSVVVVAAAVVSIGKNENRALETVEKRNRKPLANKVGF
jgi:hypothetical protein